MLENYSRVRLLTDKYRSEGAAIGSIGYIIETYPNGDYEVEFSASNGVTIAQIVAQENELRRDELAVLLPNIVTGGVETVYLKPHAGQQQNKLTRSNKK